MTAIRIDLYDEIGGWGVSSQRFMESLRRAEGQPVTLHINSPGGDVFEGFAIANALKMHKGRKVAIIEGLCASAATFPAMVCDEVQMHAQSMMMIHDPWSVAVGPAEEMDKQAEILRGIKQCMVALYSTKCGADLATIDEWLSKETWLTPDQAKAAKLCDAIIDKPNAAAARAFSRFAALFKHPPVALASPPMPPPPRKSSNMSNRKQLVSFLASALALVMTKATEGAEHPDQELQTVCRSMLEESGIPRLSALIMPLAQADGVEKSDEMAQALAVFETAKSVTGVSEGVCGALEALKKNAATKVSTVTASRDVLVEAEIQKGIKALKILPADAERWRSRIATGERSIADLKAFLSTALPASDAASSEQTQGAHTDTEKKPEPSAFVKGLTDWE